MFRIIQSLNNNAALVKDEEGNQAVVMGIGLAFQKKKGDLVIEDKIETVFALKNQEVKNNVLSSLQEIPLNVISVTYSIISRLIKTYHYPVQEYLYVTLTDHIYCAYQAVLTATYRHSKLPDISHQYPLEYQIAKEALTLFRQELLAELPDEEVCRIALHFINAKGEEYLASHDLQEISQQIMVTVERILAIHGISKTPENRHFYDRFMIHLSYFIHYLDKTVGQNASVGDLEAYIKTQDPKAYAIGSEIFEVIKEVLNKPVGSSERFYIILHIQRLL
ncbi:PRD domain-containing protein [Streptococcus sp. zg-JUN1979]|uniref:PRD domain-containing protein n=1 Tax=Streptococcus sp. zg-JUN1979 TaxID=3391450 RepID=UPI0039A5704F